MQLTLEGEQFEDTRRAVLGPGSSDLIDLVFRINLHRSLDGVPAATIEQARQLGWIGAQQTLTPLGYLVADPLREYRLWLDRERRLHSEGEYTLLARESYRGKALLEIGCGFGSQLFSMHGMEGRFVGVEPVALYRQFTLLLAEREGISAPEVVDGRGEELPFGDGEFDIVMCYSAHQYMDVRRALREMARVLKPGGQLQIVGDTLGSYVRSFSGKVAGAGIGSAKGHLLRVINTLSYSLLGRRMYVPSGASGATAAPVYPPEVFMRAWLAAAPLRVRRDLFRRLGHKTCFIAERSVANGLTGQHGTKT